MLRIGESETSSERSPKIKRSADDRKPKRIETRLQHSSVKARSVKSNWSPESSKLQERVTEREREGEQGERASAQLVLVFPSLSKERKPFFSAANLLQLKQ